jgi:acyl-ACP thioesterase
VTSLEFVPLPARGRIYRVRRRIHLGDVDEQGRLRLDALAGLLQDVATDDADDAGLNRLEGVWVLRRADLQLIDRPRFHDDVELATFCSGTGPRWAERRTRLTGRDGVVAEAAAVWVFVDREGGRPLALGEEFHARFGESAAGRRVSGRLRNPSPMPGSSTRPWALRASDFDVLGHVNNVRAMEAVQDTIALLLPGCEPARAAVEYRGALRRGETVELVSDVSDRGRGCHELSVWLVVDGDVRMSAVVGTTVRADEPD